jgi:hypothetical protein
MDVVALNAGVGYRPVIGAVGQVAATTWSSARR